MGERERKSLKGRKLKDGDRNKGRMQRGSQLSTETSLKQLRLLVLLKSHLFLVYLRGGGKVDGMGWDGVNHINGRIVLLVLPSLNFSFCGGWRPGKHSDESFI